MKKKNSINTLLEQMYKFVKDEGNKDKKLFFPNLEYSFELTGSGFMKEEKGCSISFQAAKDFLVNLPSQ